MSYLGVARIGAAMEIQKMVRKEEQAKAAQNRRYREDLQNVLSARQSEHPGCHIVVYFRCGETASWSSGSQVLEPTVENDLSPSKYEWSSEWVSVTCVVYQGEFEYWHPGMKHKPWKEYIAASVPPESLDGASPKRFKFPLLPAWYNPLSWMRILNDDTNIKNITIPGSHLSSATEASLSNADHPSGQAGRSHKAYICQQETIATQLKMGVRMIDVRCGPEGRLAVDAYHLSDQVGNVFLTCENFVREHPTQTIMVCVSWGYARTAPPGNLADRINARITQHPGLWYTGSRWPTLGEVRGKCVLLRGFQAASNSNNNGPDETGHDMVHGMSQLRAAERTPVQVLGPNSLASLVGQSPAPTIAPAIIALGDAARSETRAIDARALNEGVQNLIRNSTGRRQGLWFFNDFVSRTVVESIARMNAGALSQ
ncbi:PLC-like phosphodiesterase [Cercophora newfieldiana]|uniref:PLC-like phosphodiesterase n=1 Tax=Cercophora newfieldiana TaxID=92897 RepID=A0AA39YN23_9PEZI|nr:PLC-like phosphodiesterase [Cercophora newfieldiana]